MPRLIDALSCVGLFIKIFVRPSLFLLWVATNISSRSLMTIPVMVLSSSFVKSLTLWRLSKLSNQKMSSNKGRRSKWLILTKMVSIVIDMIKQDATLDN